MFKIKRDSRKADSQTKKAATRENATGKKGYDKVRRKAEEYAGDPKKVSRLLKDATAKLNRKNRKNGPLEEFLRKILLLINIVRDWISGTYKEVPTGSIIMMVAALLYFVLPFDLVADLLPGAGLLDDAAVTAFAFSQINHDLDKYGEWKAEQDECGKKKRRER